LIFDVDKYKLPAATRIGALLVAMACLLAGVQGKGAVPQTNSTNTKPKSSSGKKTTSTRHRSSSARSVKSSSRSRGKSSTRSTKGRRQRLPRSSRARLAALHLDPQRVEEIQQALIREGFLKGPATGTWDDATRDAMRRYQSNNGFSATGLPDAKSLMKLGLGPHPLPEDVKPAAAARASVEPAAQANPN
jgi:peptidoglycan hydrolase-like protein with peptidoglycan-binding domain